MWWSRPKNCPILLWIRFTGRTAGKLNGATRAPFSAVFASSETKIFASISVGTALGIFEQCEQQGVETFYVNALK
jgi:hypothetical protein